MVVNDISYGSDTVKAKITRTSDLGQRQADALGSAFNASSTHFTHFYTSDLSRAHSTALAVVKHHVAPKPPLTMTEKLREQHFGIAETHPWMLSPGNKTLEEWYKMRIFPKVHGRDAKFPEGDSLNDVAPKS